MSEDSRRLLTEEIVLQKCAAAAMKQVQAGNPEMSLIILEAASIVAEAVASEFGRTIGPTEIPLANQEKLVADAVARHAEQVVEIEEGPVRLPRLSDARIQQDPPKPVTFADIKGMMA